MIINYFLYSNKLYYKIDHLYLYTQKDCKNLLKLYKHSLLFLTLDNEDTLNIPGNK